MKRISIEIGENDIEDLKKIFSNEQAFQPQAREDHLIIAILKQVIENSDNSSSYTINEATEV